MSKVVMLENPRSSNVHQKRLKELINIDPVRMQILRQVRALGAPDCWVAAGFVRSLVWDHLHQRTSSPLPFDVDVIWYDAEQTDGRIDQRLEATLNAINDNVNWSVKNQARMHSRNGDFPYHSATDAMQYWPETATAVAVRLSSQNDLEIAAPFGLEDIFALLVRPTPRFSHDKYPVFLERIRSKRWDVDWPELTFVKGG